MSKGKYEKLIIKILTGRADSGIRFEQLCQLLKKLGFIERIKGSHHIFHKSSVEEIINIQEQKGKAKKYQVKQVRELIVKYKLKIDKGDEI